MRNFDDRAERLKVVPHGYKKIVDVCGSKWPRNLPVIAAAAYMGMSERRFRAEPQLAGLIQLQFGVEIVDKVQLDLLQDELSFGSQKPFGMTDNITLKEEKSNEEITDCGVRVRDGDGLLRGAVADLRAEEPAREI